MVPDLITHMLTGSCATEPSIASTTQLMDAAVKQWDPAMLELAEIARSSMPVIEPLGSDAGAIADDIAAGMRMVRVCEHDTASAVASVELLPGDVFISCGTWSLVGVERDAPVLTKEAERANLSNETGAGNSTLLLANCTGLWIAQQLKPELEQELGVDLSWEDIASAVASRDGASFVFDTEEPSLAQPGNMLEKLGLLARKSGYEGSLGVAEFSSRRVREPRPSVPACDRADRKRDRRSLRANQAHWGRITECGALSAGGRRVRENRRRGSARGICDWQSFGADDGPRCVRDVERGSRRRRSLMVPDGICPPRRESPKWRKGCPMLKGVPANVSPELLKVLSEMGHGDEIVIADGNFPAASLARRLVRADGLGVPELLESVLGLLPLDTYVESPLALMATVEGDEEPGSGRRTRTSSVARSQIPQR